MATSHFPARSAANPHWTNLAEGLQDQEDIEQQHHDRADDRREVGDGAIGELAHDVAASREDDEGDHGKRQGNAEHDLTYDERIRRSTIQPVVALAEK